MKKEQKLAILKYLTQHPSTQLREIAENIGVSKQYISRLMKELIESGEVIKTGQTKGASFTAANYLTPFIKSTLERYDETFTLEHLTEDEVLTDIKKNSTIFATVPEKAYRIIEYTFLEMMNNAIDHSKSDTARIIMQLFSDSITFTIIDFGEGVFNTIQKKMNLPTTLDAIQELLKGKTTTAPTHHSGEGIFFTSKSVDRFTIDSGEKRLLIRNDDTTVQTIDPFKGSRVQCSVNLNTSTILKNVFDRFTNEDLEFSITEIEVDLYELADSHISRSQARRMLIHLDKFKKIILNFKNVDAVGQGFADEVFRVWQNQHPTIAIEYKNTNEDVEFMIKRALAHKQ